MRKATKVKFYILALLFFFNKSEKYSNKPNSGGYSTGVPPLPIPNREVKPGHVDGTAYLWESR